MAALWLHVYLTPLKRKHVGVSQVHQVTMRDLQTYQRIHAHENLLGHGQKYLPVRTKMCTKQYKVTVAILGIRAATASSLRMQSIAQLSVSSIQVT